jgi:hypothetical protein
MPINVFATERIQGVLGTFVGAVNAFNDNDWDTYSQYLDENVVALMNPLIFAGLEKA